MASSMDSPSYKMPASRLQQVASLFEDMAHAAYFSWVPGERTIQFSHNFQALLGLAPSLSLHSVIRLISLNLWQQIRRTLSAKPSGSIHEFETLIGHPEKEQTKLRIHLLVSLQRDGKSKELYVVGILTIDYPTQTVDKTSDATLLQVFEQILQRLPVVLNLMDKEGRIQQLRGNGLRLIQLNAAESVGKLIFDTYPTITPYILRAMKGEEVRFTEEIRNEGQAVYFLSHFFSIPEIQTLVGFSIDISESSIRETAYHRMATKNLELAERNELLDTVVYATAHDLKTPIANLELLMNFIENAQSEEERLQYWQALKQSAQRLKQTSHGLMEVISFENTESQAKLIRLDRLIKLLLDEFRPQLEQQNTTLNLELAVTKFVYNEAYLESILRNLISNALKYSKHDVPLVLGIRTQKSQEGILLEVSDNGIGIDLKAHKDRLFRPFKRFTQQAQGSGVGLYLLKRIVERNGGWIDVLSEVGKGTRFLCYLLPYSTPDPVA